MFLLPLPTSLPKSAVKECLPNIPYKKSVETCRAHRTSGIGKHHAKDELRNKYPTLSYIPCEVQQGLYVGYTNRMSVALFLPFC